MSVMSLYPRDDEVYTAANQRVSQTTFLIVSWLFTALSAVFVCARLYIRVKSFRKLALDDFLVIFAWTLILAFAITWQIKIPILYWQFDVLTGKRPYTADFLPAYGTFMPFVAVWNILFYCCLWSIKFSFLVFFRGLDSKVRTHRIWWWVVFVVTCAGLIASIADIDYQCSTTGIMHIVANCTKKNRVQFDNATLFANMAADIFTDMLILSIPVIILWNVQIKLKKKLILLGIFSATIIIMIVAIIRAALVKAHAKETASIDWLYLWSVVEMGVAIMIACVASFRQLFISQSNQHLYGTGSSPSKWNLLSYLRSKTRGSSKTSSRSSSERGDWAPEMEEGKPYQAKQARGDSQTYSITVQSEYTVRSEV